MSHLLGIATVLPSTLTRKDSLAQEKVDALAIHMLAQPQVDLGIKNTFTPGLYARQCTMPSGTLTISKIHKTEHQFVILKGEIGVWTEETGVKRYKAPYHGITKPGTRRVLIAITDTDWITFHPTEETDLDKIETLLIEPRDLTTKQLENIKLCLGD